MEMKINRINQAALGNVKQKQEEASGKISFTELISEQKSQGTIERLNKKLHEDIERQGKILANTLTVEDLMRYKKMVREFMDEAVRHSVKLEETRGFGRGGRVRRFKVIKEIDKKIVELTDTVIKKQEKELNVLGLVGEIQGLLLNIYA